MLARVCMNYIIDERKIKMKKKLLLFPVCLLMICSCGETQNNSSSISQEEIKESTSSTTNEQDVPISEEIIKDDSVKLYDLKVNDEVNPLGIDDSNVHFSWKMDSLLLGEKQQAYNIIVKDGDDVVWDSGRIYSSNSVAIPYEGTPLSSATKYRSEISVT